MLRNRYEQPLLWDLVLDFLWCRRLVVLYYGHDTISVTHIGFFKFDGSVKSPISALRFIPRHCGVLHINTIPKLMLIARTLEDLNTP
jgi:hypothetical protein